MGNGKFNIQSTSTNKEVDNGKGYRALYTNRGVITSEDGNAEYFRDLDTGKKVISLYAMSDGTVSYNKNDREVIKTDKAAKRLFKRKEKKMDRIEKRFK